VRLFCDAYAEHRSEPTSKWGFLTPFPWCNVLDAEEMADMVDEIERLTPAATTGQGVDELRRCLSVWEDWADHYRTPAYRRALRAEIRASRASRTARS
jgi:hypothetical protein